VHGLKNNLKTSSPRIEFEFLGERTTLTLLVMPLIEISYRQTFTHKYLITGFDVILCDTLAILMGLASPIHQLALPDHDVGTLSWLESSLCRVPMDPFAGSSAPWANQNVLFYSAVEQLASDMVTFWAVTCVTPNADAHANSLEKQLHCWRVLKALAWHQDMEMYTVQYIASMIHENQSRGSLMPAAVQ
jgi:hypothetical protein